MKFALSLIVSVMILLAMSGSVSAIEYYIDPVNGNDANDGLSSTTAWRSLEKAFRIGNNTPYEGVTWDTRYSPADPATVYLMNGTFVLNESLTIAADYLTVKNYPGHNPKIYDDPMDGGGSYAAVVIKIDGWSGGDFTNITIEGLELEGGYSYALIVGDHLSNVTIRNNKLHGSGRDVIKISGGLASQGGNALNSHTIIENNEIYDSGVRDPTNAEGIDAMAISHATVRNNYIHDITTTGMYFKGNSEYILVENNFLYNIGTISNTMPGPPLWDTYGGIYFGECSSQGYIPLAPNNFEAMNSIARNNIIVKAGGSPLRAMGAKNVSFVQNTIFNDNRTFSPYDGHGWIDTGAITVFRGCSVLPTERNQDVTFTNNLIIDSLQQGYTPEYQNQMVLIGGGAWDSGNTSTNLELDYNYYFRRDADYRWIDRTEGVDETLFSAWKAAMPPGIDANSVVPSNSTNLIAILDNPSLPEDDVWSYERGSTVPSNIGADVYKVGLISASGFNIDPIYSHIKNFAINYFDMDDTEATWAGQHLDLIIGHYHPVPKQYNPDIIFFKYISCQSVILNSQEFSDTWNACIQNTSNDCEDMFFHLVQDANVADFQNIETRFVPGWNPDDDQGQCSGIANDGINDLVVSCGGSPSNSTRTAVYKNESRFPGWTWQQRLINFNNSFWSESCTDRVTQSFDTGYGDEYAGLMNDEIGNEVPPNVPVPVLELDLNDQDGDYTRKTAAYLIVLCNKVWAKGKVCSINAAGAKDTYAHIVDVDLNEFWFTYAQELAWYQMNSTRGYARPFNEDNYYQMKQVQRASQYGTSELIQFMGNDWPAWPCSDDSIERDRYYFLSLYYQVKDENAMFSWFPASAGAIYNIPPSQLWIPAIEVDIGQPEGGWEVINGTNSNYNNNPGGYYEMFVRNYTKGRVYTLPRPHWQSCIGDTTFNYHELGGVFRKVNYDGSIGPPITSIDIRWKEGFILLQEEPCPDLNNDNKVNIIDLVLVIFHQGRNSGDSDWSDYSHLDTNTDSIIDYDDVLMIISNFGSVC